MDRRIFGVETEFGIAYSGPDSRPLSPEEVARYLFRKVVSWGRSSNVFLTNGSRLYLDVGSHPEYATAECDDLAQLIAHDRAGELILDDLVDEAEERLQAEGFNGSVYLFKNNTDSAGNSYGSHENYLIPRRLEFSRLADILIPFLVTRQLLVGAGKVLKTQSGSLYAFSQRADHIWEGVSSATTRSRPIINTRDEPHADAEHYRRLHVIAGDSNMSETTSMLKVGTVDLMLRMIEAGVIMRDLRLENPIRSIREISHDLTGSAPLKLANGSSMTALELQHIYLERAADFVDANGAHNRYVPRILDLWGRALDAVETGDISGIDTEIDWAIKKKIVDRYAERSGLDMGSPRLAQIDLTYHDISRKRGLFYLLQSRGETARVVDDSDIKEAVDVPPQSTRAKLRGDFVRRAKAANRDFTVDWVHLKLNDRAQQTVLCKDPFAAVDERVEALLSTL
ncbi:MULTISPECIES: Pup--protein ligase [Arthrobacter]|uniref:Pup--protein ligase n=1 Tax=Arthrobacter caoxuetaonis TaxID=2886935 RepID=A0A9X1MGD9_9MICC|nr:MULTISPECIES: Pup--protein ligase [Arthrobacter]MCC3283391.1 Pup--protein ligase [Arthrobacter caoxuetaonis]MCC3298790.1 Pup--protein ligase [Arthrobacter caoxuetaonis]MCC9193506.1 Pup--protein ligase [Arthrobacter sp. zg-Y916]USQ55860.1 Pup--protein ligase [Arthrobacter caoxuetaonis]